MTRAALSPLAAIALFTLVQPAAWAEPKTSLASETDDEGWQAAGFRLALGASAGPMFGASGAPTGSLLGPVLRVGFRLDRAWSLQGSFQYQLARAELSGLRYAATLEPRWHFARHWSVALGLGVAGIVEGRNTGRADPEPRADSLETSYTFPDAKTPLPRCTGSGVAGLGRLEWTAVLGQRTATGLGLELFAQSTRCIDDSGRLEPDSARPIVRRQLWPHVGVAASWVITWR